jgi:hypothetical protein
MTEHMMFFWKERAKNRYYVFGIMPGFNHDLPDDCAQTDPYWQQPWEVNEELFDCIRAYYRDVQTENIKYDLGERCESDTE